MTLAIDGIAPHLFGAPGAFRGALVSKDVNQVISTATATLLLWQLAEYDVGGWFGASGDNFLTVPPGVHRVRMSSGLNWAASTGTFKDIAFLKNAVVSQGLPKLRLPGVSVDVALSSPIIEVVPGDTLEVEVRHDMGAGVNARLGTTTFFGVEAVR